MKNVLKWLLRVTGALVFAMVLATIWFYYSSESRINREYRVETQSLHLPEPDSTILAAGLYVAQIRGCADCHGADLAGNLFFDEMPVARVSAPNITPAGPVSSYKTEDWVRSVRHGVGRDGKPFWIMPSDAYTGISEGDLAALILYLKSLEPIVSEQPDVKELGPIGRMLVATNGLKLPVKKIDHSRPFPIKPPVGPTVEFGFYLLDECRHCHGANLTGGIVAGDPSSPPSSNLTPGPEGIGHYDRDVLERALRTGVKPDGSVMNPMFMPWSASMHFTDVEIDAIWAYLRSLEPLPTGS